MDDSLRQQLIILIRFCISGLAIGFLFDFFRIQRKIIKTFDIITYIQDIIFWIITAIIIIATVIKYTDGEVRSYMIIGLGIGLLLYFYFFSKLIIKCAMKIVSYIKKILSILVYPIKKFFKIAKKD